MRRRALAPVLLFGTLSTACAGRGLSLSTGSNKVPDPALLLSCARAVATDKGFDVISKSSEQFELQAKSRFEPSIATLPSYDVLTVTLAPAKRGFRMLVGSASYAMRQFRGVATTGGSSAWTKTEWVGTSPSPRVALARDAVLEQCGSVGH